MKKTLIIVASVILVIALSIGGTLAYLTSTDSSVNVTVIGNIKIEQYEQDRNGNDFVQFQTLMPIVQPTSIKDEAGYPACDNYIDQIVTVKNTGKNDAYVRTFVAIPYYYYEGHDDSDASTNVIHWNGYSAGDAAPKYPIATKIPGTNKNVENTWVWGKDENNVWPGNDGEWNSFNTTIDGQDYYVIAITSNTVLKPSEITAPNFTGFYLDSMVDFNGEHFIYEGKIIDGMTPQINVLIATVAVQAAGWNDAFTALDTAFGVPSAQANPWVLEAPQIPVGVENATDLTNGLANGKNVFMMSDINADRQISVNNGNLLDGTGNTLTINNDDVSYGLTVTAGIAKNLTINGTLGAYEMTGDVTYENVKVVDTTYGINIGSGNGHSLTMINCILGDQNRYSSIGSAQFEGCTFTSANNYYASQYISANATFTYIDCDFEQNVYQNNTGRQNYYLDSNGNGTIVFDNCRIDGLTITAENINSYFRITNNVTVIVK